MDELQSVGVGVALGLVIVSFLTLYPGESFDYTTDYSSSYTSDCVSPKRATSSTDAPKHIKISTKNNENGIQQHQQIAVIDRDAQLVKVQKLQELLGLEKEKAQQLLERAKEKAWDNVNRSGGSNGNHYSIRSKTAWLDRGFFTVMFGLLVWVLWQDYSINLFSVAEHLLPRETEVIHQVAAVPRGLLSQLLELWEYMQLNVSFGTVP